MPPLADPEIHDRLQAALNNWQVNGYVRWSKEAWDWVREHLKGVSLKDIAGWMCQYLSAGGAIEQVSAPHPEEGCQQRCYAFRLAVDGRSLYLKTVLLDEDSQDPVVQVVSIHEY